MIFISHPTGGRRDKPFFGRATCWHLHTVIAKVIICNGRLLLQRNHIWIFLRKCISSVFIYIVCNYQLIFIADCKHWLFILALRMKLCFVSPSWDLKHSFKDVIGMEMFCLSLLWLDSIVGILWVNLLIPKPSSMLMTILDTIIQYDMMAEQETWL